MHHQVCESQNESNIHARVDSGVVGFGVLIACLTRLRHDQIGQVWRHRTKRQAKLRVQCRRHQGRQGEPQDWAAPNTRGNSRLMHRKKMPQSDDNIHHERCRLALKHTSGQEAISIGRYYIHINSDDEEDNQNPNVSGDARRAQEEANHDAAAQGNEDEAEEVPGEDDDMDAQGYTCGYASEEEDSGWHYRDTDLASRDIISSQRMAICLDEPREAQYMARFIALQMSKMWGMFEGGEERTMNARLEGQDPSDRLRSVKITFV